MNESVLLKTMHPPDGPTDLGWALPTSAGFTGIPLVSQGPFGHGWDTSASLHVSFDPSRRSVWIYPHGSGKVPTEWKHGRSLKLRSQLDRCHFDLIIPSKASPDSRGREIDNASWWEELPTHLGCRRERIEARFASMYQRELEYSQLTW